MDRRSATGIARASPSCSASPPVVPIHGAKMSAGLGGVVDGVEVVAMDGDQVATLVFAEEDARPGSGR